MSTIHTVLKPEELKCNVFHCIEDILHHYGINETKEILFRVCEAAKSNPQHRLDIIFDNEIIKWKSEQDNNKIKALSPIERYVEREEHGR